MSITITSKRVKFTDGSGSFLSQDLVIGEDCYDLNFFTDSGNWIKKMQISKDGKKLTVFINDEWFDSSEAQENSGIVARLKRECTKNNVEFPFTEVVFKFVDSKYGIIRKKVKETDIVQIVGRAGRGEQ